MDPERIINSFMEYSKTFELFWFIFIKKKTHHKLFSTS